MPIQYIYKIRCRVYDENGTQKEVNSGINFSNPINKGDVIYLGDRELLVEKIIHNLNSDISVLKTSHLTKDVKQEANHLENILKEINRK